MQPFGDLVEFVLAERSQVCAGLGSTAAIAEFGHFLEVLRGVTSMAALGTLRRKGELIHPWEANKAVQTKGRTRPKKEGF